MKTEELICTVCPVSCTLRVYVEKDDFRVEGNACPKGREYAYSEVTDPRRVVMSVIPVRNGDYPTVSVKTDKPVSKKCIEEVMKRLTDLVVDAPVEIGQVILRDICGANIVATRRVRKTT